MLPSPEDKARFWSLIEAAWAVLGPDVRQTRQALVTRRAGTEADTSVLRALLPLLMEILTVRCRRLSGAELISLDRVAERKLWEIDRAALHAVTGGSQDGFLYTRGFIVAMGREFYDSVAGNPEMAVPNAECEEMCYFFANMHDDRFGSFPRTGSGISRESGENMVGWIA